MSWDLVSDRPIYVQLVEELTLRIISGFYKLGEKLPTVRELAAEASVNPNTMQKALSELENSNLINTQRTTGKYVTDKKEAVKIAKNAIADKVINDFISKMNALGFSKSETFDYLKNIIEEDDINE